MSTGPQTQKEYHVFLSHFNSDKEYVEKIAQRLEDEAQLKPFLDKWHLIPGAPWQEALERALDGSESCAVFLGVSGLGAWENEEMRAALDERVKNEGFRVIPVLLPGADLKDENTLPRFLRRLTWVDFREGTNSQEAFHRLVAGIKGESPGRAIYQQSQVDPKQAPKTKYVLVLSATIEEVDKYLAEALLDHIRYLADDSHITLNKIEEGSVVLYLEGSQEGFEKLKSLFNEGNLNYLQWTSVLNVQEINNVNYSLIEDESEKTIYHQKEEHGQVVSILAMRGGKIIREIDPQSKEGRYLLGYEESSMSGAA